MPNRTILQTVRQNMKRRKRVAEVEKQFGCHYGILLDTFTYIDFMLGHGIDTKELYGEFRRIGVNPQTRKEFYHYYDLLLDTFEDSPKKDYTTNPKEVDLGFFNFIVYQGVRDYLSKFLPAYNYSSHQETTLIPIRFLRDLDNPIQRKFLFPLTEEIEERRKNKKGRADMARRIVQNIPYGFEENTRRGKYPYEVLYDMKGVCCEKSGLLAFLLRELDFGVAVFDFSDHRAVGIRSRNGNFGTDYAYIETTDDYHVGEIPANFQGEKPELIVIEKGLSYN
jgi:hypothetical protein